MDIENAPTSAPEVAALATNPSSPRNLFELGQVISQKAETIRHQALRQIANDPRVKTRVPVAVTLEVNVLSLITDSIVSDLFYAANLRKGLFASGADKLTFEFVPLELLVETEPDISNIELELIQAISSLRYDEVIVLLGEEVIAKLPLDTRQEGKFGAIKIRKLRTQFEITGAGRRLDR